MGDDGEPSTRAAASSLESQRRELDDDLIRGGTKTFFDKDLTNDPWELEFVRFYEQFRESVRVAQRVDEGVRLLFGELRRVTVRTSKLTGRRRTAYRETAMLLAAELGRLAGVVNSE